MNPAEHGEDKLKMDILFIKLCIYLLNYTLQLLIKNRNTTQTILF